MKLSLDLTKDINENAALCYERAKRAKEKAEGAKKALETTQKEVLALEREEQKPKQEKKVRVKRELEWFEKFHWFESSDGFLVYAGRDAQQNDLIYSRYLQENDLFFHADIQGAPATVVRNGKEAPEKTLLEAAQFAASYSSAWKVGAASVDVYAVEKSQLSKHASGGFVGKGGFAIAGERKWFKNTQLALVIGEGEKGVLAIPAREARTFKQAVKLIPGGKKEKGEIAKELAKRFALDANEILQILPSGNTRMSEREKGV
ncbi:MAG: NFACT RNA binding domain-containing protein [Candidatus Micrarchaeota archaeon]